MARATAKAKPKATAKAKASTTKAKAKAPTKAKPKASASAKRRSGMGLQQPVRPDAALADVVGASPAPRTEITRRMWDYIKSNRLQDPDDRRMIRPDQKLKKVTGAKQKVSMFELAKHLNAHVS